MLRIIHTAGASLALVLAILPMVAFAVPLPAELTVEERATVRQAFDGGILLLADGRQVRLAGIQTPIPASRVLPTTPSPLIEAARGALVNLTEGHEVGLAYSGLRRDRYGRVVAHVVDSTGNWLQAELLARGLARVVTTIDERAVATEMLAIERGARLKRIGLWANPNYHVLSTAEPSLFVETFQIVEGPVTGIETTNGWTFIRMGRIPRGITQWKPGLVLLIGPDARRLFQTAGIDPNEFDGRTLRVRGWIGMREVAEIEITHPEQIEILKP